MLYFSRHTGRLLERILPYYAILNIFAAVILFYKEREAFFRFTREDGFIEYSTAFFLLGCTLLCVIRAFNSKNKYQFAFYALAALAFFFGFGEEISWGQRIFNFNTPEHLQRINEQNEFTIHNIEVYGISFKKILFRLVLNIIVLFYFFVFPILYKTQIRFRNLVIKYSIPVSKPLQSKLFLVAFISVFLIDEGKKWELAEFAISCFTFLVFLFPSNHKVKLSM